ncbi:MAG TPA: hypothetical protein VHE13_11375 [Opitutus sp.]|nr:hypothetical protein [Opitutus sp.]
MPVKLIGLFLLLGSFLAFARLARASALGVTGPRHRRVTRDSQPWKFRLTLILQYLGAAVCLVAGALCLVHFTLRG